MKGCVQSRLVRKAQVRAFVRAPRGRSLCRCIGTEVSAAVEARTLGKSGLEVPIVGIGAWSWGDRSGYWGYGREYGKEESRRAYKALVDAGLTFIDTAEVYGFGMSEEFLGEFMKETNSKPQIATKFAPLPWRLNSESVVIAAKASLQRLQLEKMSLYIQHWPGFLTNYFSNDAYLEGLLKVYEAGLTEAVGVSNFNAWRTRNAAKLFASRGACLSSNQVQYSLLYRAPERNGVLDACNEFGVTLVAYSPLAQGLLTGKYTVESSKPSGPRGAIINDKRIREVEPLLSVMKAIGTEREKSLAQIALNWTICKGALPIPGVKNERQLAEVAGATGWRLSDGEVAELDLYSGKIPSGFGTGAPFENW